MKEEKGITIIVLAITVIVMLIILGITVSSGGDSLETAQLQSFVADCEIIQSKVDVISEKARINPEYLGELGITSNSSWDNDTLKEKFNISNLTHDIQATFSIVNDENLTEDKNKVTVNITLTNDNDILYGKYSWENGKVKKLTPND